MMNDADDDDDESRCLVRAQMKMMNKSQAFYWQIACSFQFANKQIANDKIRIIGFLFNLSLLLSVCYSSVTKTRFCCTRYLKSFFFSIGVFYVVLFIFLGFGLHCSKQICVCMCMLADDKLTHILEMNKNITKKKHTQNKLEILFLFFDRK